MSSAVEFIARWRFPGLFVLLLVEESGVPMPLPGDWVILALGALARTEGGAIRTGATVLLIATVAVSLGSSLLFTLARGAARPVLLRLTHRFGLKDERRERLETWIRRRGAWALIGGRLIPGARVALTLTAGVLAMPRATFTRGIVPAAAIWSAIYFGLGYGLGATYQELAPRFPRYGALSAGVAAGLVAVAIVARRWVLARRTER